MLPQKNDDEALTEVRWRLLRVTRAREAQMASSKPHAKSLGRSHAAGEELLVAANAPRAEDRRGPADGGASFIAVCSRLGSSNASGGWLLPLRYARTRRLGITFNDARRQAAARSELSQQYLRKWFSRFGRTDLTRAAGRNPLHGATAGTRMDASDDTTFSFGFASVIITDCNRDWRRLSDASRGCGRAADVVDATLGLESRP
jgi:hypothetical protein